MMKTYILYGSIARNRRLVVKFIIQCVATIVTCLSSLSLATAADLIGSVRQGGNPVSGAIVTLVPDTQPAAGPAKSTTTDTNGNYVISGVVPGRYKLICNDREQPPVVIDYAINRQDCDL